MSWSSDAKLWESSYEIRISLYPPRPSPRHIGLEKPYLETNGGLHAWEVPLVTAGRGWHLERVSCIIIFQVDRLGLRGGAVCYESSKKSRPND